MLGKIVGRRRRGQQRMRWLDGNTNSRNMSWGKLREIVKDRKAWCVWGPCATVHGVTKSWTQLRDCTTISLESIGIGFGYVEFEDLWGIYLKCHLAFDLGKSGGQN